MDGRGGNNNKGGERREAKRETDGEMERDQREGGEGLRGGTKGKKKQRTKKNPTNPKKNKKTESVTGCPYGVSYLGSSGVGAWGCVDITDKDTCCSDIAPLPSTLQTLRNKKKKTEKLKGGKEYGFRVTG